jgi:hypothetical protein
MSKQFCKKAFRNAERYFCINNALSAYFLVVRVFRLALLITRQKNVELQKPALEFWEYSTNELRRQLVSNETFQDKLLNLSESDFVKEQVKALALYLKEQERELNNNRLTLDDFEVLIDIDDEGNPYCPCSDIFYSS